MTNYERGVRYEREIMQLFRDAGYEIRDVARTAGSHSWFDVVATKKTLHSRKVCYIAVLVQCKTEKLR